MQTFKGFLFFLAFSVAGAAGCGWAGATDGAGGTGGGGTDSKPGTYVRRAKTVTILPTGVTPAARILAVAKESVGKQMWSGYGLSSGKLGCAAALCNVMKESGFPYAKSATVVIVRNQLLHGPARIKEISIKDSSEYGVNQSKLVQAATPGDLIMGYMNTPDKPNSGGDAHCGVVAGNGEVYANDWVDGIWKRDVVDRFFAWYHHVYVMKILPPVGIDGK